MTMKKTRLNGRIKQHCALYMEFIFLLVVSYPSLQMSLLAQWLH